MADLHVEIVTPRKVTFLAKEQYFTGTGVKGTLSRAWFTGIGMVGGVDIAPSGSVTVKILLTISGCPISFAQEALTNTSARPSCLGMQVTRTTSCVWVSASGWKFLLASTHSPLARLTT